MRPPLSQNTWFGVYSEGCVVLMLLCALELMRVRSVKRLGVKVCGGAGACVGRCFLATLAGDGHGKVRAKFGNTVLGR